jgi:hypothetical protein
MNHKVDERHLSDRFLVYSRYFAKIPKYFQKALKSFKLVKPYKASIKLISPKIERVFFYLGLGVIAYEIFNKFYNLKKSDSKFKNLFLIDTILWHCLASFLLPSLVIGNSVHYFVAALDKVIQNKKIHTLACVSFSVLWIYSMMSPMDKFAHFILDNSYRRYLNYKTTS